MTTQTAHSPVTDPPQHREREPQTMDPIQQQYLVHDHQASLAAEAAAERLARRAHALDGHPADERDLPEERPEGRRLRAALGRALIGVGTMIASGPRRDEPCVDAGSGHPA